MDPSHTSQAEKEADLMFRKKFCFQPSSEWIVPLIASINTDSIWELDEFQKLKDELNSVKSLLNDKGELWHTHTSNINKAGLIMNNVRRLAKPEFLTQAWCKFYEIVASFPIVQEGVDVFHSFHLCEAPGAFVSSLNYYLCLNRPELEWKWYANTLNPYYEGHSTKSVVVDDRLLFHTLKNWYFGSDNTGDILNPCYLEDVKVFFSQRKLVNLVTADGSICCIENPGEQELTVSDLQFAEVLIALQVLADGGSLVVKKFTFFESISICVMYLLNCFFEKVHVFKPATSKAGNSEVYVICIGYKGRHVTESYILPLQEHLSLKGKALIALESIPESFRSQLKQCCEYFMEQQIASIKSHISCFGCMTPESSNHLMEVKEHCANIFVEKYSLEALSHRDYHRLYFTTKKHITAFGHMHRDLKQISCIAMGSTFDRMRIIPLMAWEEYLLDLETRINSCFPPTNIRQTWNFDKFHQRMKYCMRHINPKTWMTTGKKFDTILNSKFCNPLLLQLWDEITENTTKVVPETHAGDGTPYWDFNPLRNACSGSPNLCKSEVIFNIEIEGGNPSHLASHLCKALSPALSVHRCNLNTISEQIHCELQKICVIDTTVWCQSFDVELFIKDNFVRAISSAIKIMKPGDNLVLCVPILLTRFSVGILFMVTSLFSRVSTMLPYGWSPALVGQIWVFFDFCSPPWTEVVLDYTEKILKLEPTNDFALLEVVPIASLCEGPFYSYLLSMNCGFMLQRLKSLVATEKKVAGVIPVCRPIFVPFS